MGGGSIKLGRQDVSGPIPYHSHHSLKANIFLENISPKKTDGSPRKNSLTPKKTPTAGARAVEWDCSLKSPSHLKNPRDSRLVQGGLPGWSDFFVFFYQNVGPMLAPPRVGQRVAGCKPTASCLFQILDRRSSAGVSSHGTILRDKESWHSLGKKRCGFKLRKLQAEILGNSWQDKCKSLGQIMVYGSSLSPWEASLRNAAGPFFSSSSNRFWPHASWSFPVAFPMAATPESLCPWRAKYSQKTEPQQERLNFFALQPQKTMEKLGTDRWMTPKISFLFNFQPGKSCFNCFFYHASTCQCCLASSRNVS